MCLITKEQKYLKSKTDVICRCRIPSKTLFYRDNIFF